MNIQSFDYEGVAVHVEQVTMRSIDEVCECLFFYGHKGLTTVYGFGPDHMVLCPADYMFIRNEIAENTNGYREPAASDILAVTRYINQTTGRLMDIYVSRRLKQGTIIFGLYRFKDETKEFDPVEDRFRPGGFWYLEAR